MDFSGDRAVLDVGRRQQCVLSAAGFRSVTKIRCDTWTAHGIVIGHKS